MRLLSAVLLAAVISASLVGSATQQSPGTMSGTVSEPIPIFTPAPPYSEEAQKAGVSGVVVVEVMVDAAGNVRDARVVKPLGHGLDEKAVETIRTWRFRPAMRNGVPVAGSRVVQIDFHPSSIPAQPGSKPPPSAAPSVVPGESGRAPYSTEAVSFSPDGRSLATVSLSDPTVVVWDLETGRIRRTLAGHAGFVTSLAFHPNSRWLAAASWDSTVKLWDATAGNELHTLGGHTRGVYAVAFTRDGSLASVSIDGALKLWESATGHELRTIPLGGVLQSASFSPDGSLLATRSSDPADTTIKVWDVAQGHELRAIPAGAGRAMAFSPDRSLLAQADRSEAAIKIIEVATGLERRRLKLGGKPDLVNSLVFSPNGRWLASVQSLNPVSPSVNLVHVWDVETGVEALRLPSTGGIAVMQGSGASTFLPGVAFSPDGRWLASTAGALFGIATPRDLLSGRAELVLTTGNASRVSELAFRNDGRVLVSRSRDELRLWDVSTGQNFRTLVGVSDDAGAVLFSPDLRLLATEVGGGNTIRLWDAEAVRELRRFAISSDGKGSGVSSLAFSPDAHVLAVGGFNRVMLADLSTGRELRTVVTGQDPGVDAEHMNEMSRILLLRFFVSGLAFTGDGRRLVCVGNEHKSLELWDAVTGQRLADHNEAEEPGIFSTAISHDGRWLAALRLSQSRGSQLVLFDGPTLREVRTFSAVSSVEVPVSTLSFSPDGQRLAAVQTSTGASAVEIWDTSTGQLLRTSPLYRSGGEVLVAAFSNDWHWLATAPPGDTETSIDVWELPSGRHVRTLPGVPVRWLRGNAPPLEAPGAAPDYPPLEVFMARSIIQNADALAKKGDRTAAIAEYQEAVKLVPNNAELHFTLGAQFEARGATAGGYGGGRGLSKAARADYQSALEQYRLAHQLAPNNSSYKGAYERINRLLRRL